MTKSASPISILGASGHAKVVIAAMLAVGRKPAAIYDDDSSKWGTLIMGFPVEGPISEFGKRRSLPAVIAIGDNAARARLAAGFRGTDWATVVHPAAIVDPSAKIGQGAVIFAGCVIQPETRIGAHVIVNTAATIDHDCVIGACAHLAPGSHLAGGVSIGEGTLVGGGASVIPNKRIGSWSVVGAGAAVTKDIPDRVTAVGVPATIIRQVPAKARRGPAIKSVI